MKLISLLNHYPGPVKLLSIDIEMALQSVIVNRLQYAVDLDIPHTPRGKKIASYANQDAARNPQYLQHHLNV